MAGRSCCMGAADRQSLQSRTFQTPRHRGPGREASLILRTPDQIAIRLYQVRLFPLLFLLPAFAYSQGAPIIGVVDIYGARRTSAPDIRKALGLKEGARLSG